MPTTPEDREAGRRAQLFEQRIRDLMRNPSVVRRHLVIDDERYDGLTVCGIWPRDSDVHGLGERGLLDVDCTACKRPVQEAASWIMDQLGKDTDVI